MSKFQAVMASLAVPTLLCLATVAEAAPRSLAAATARLPESVTVLGTSHVKAARSTKLFAKLLPMLLDEEEEVAKGLDLVKKLCKLDVVQSVEDASLALEDREGILLVALTGVDEQKAVDCATKLGKVKLGASAKAEKLTSKADATLYRLAADKEEVFFAWLPGEIVAIATDEDDKALLERMLSGKGAIKKSKIAGKLARLDPTAVLSAVWSKEETFEGKTVRGGDVKIDIRGGAVTADVSAEMQSTRDAQEVVGLIDSVKSVLGKISPGASIDARASGSVVLIQARASESELLKALEQAAPKKRRR